MCDSKNNKSGTLDFWFHLARNVAIINFGNRPGHAALGGNGRIYCCNGVVGVGIWLPSQVEPARWEVPPAAQRNRKVWLIWGGPSWPPVGRAWVCNDLFPRTPAGRITSGFRDMVTKIENYKWMISNKEDRNRVTINRQKARNHYIYFDLMILRRTSKKYHQFDWHILRGFVPVNACLSIRMPKDSANEPRVSRATTSSYNLLTETRTWYTVQALYRR